jgi:hypothetical protein
MACDPISTALRNAAMLFSGNAALYPRWAMACGNSARLAASRPLPGAEWAGASPLVTVAASTHRPGQHYLYRSHAKNIGTTPRSSRAAPSPAILGIGLQLPTKQIHVNYSGTILIIALGN